MQEYFEVERKAIVVETRLSAEKKFRVDMQVRQHIL
jgi:hypothetical protein